MLRIGLRLSSACCFRYSISYRCATVTRHSSVIDHPHHPFYPAGGSESNTSSSRPSLFRSFSSQVSQTGDSQHNSNAVDIDSELTRAGVRSVTLRQYMKKFDALTDIQKKVLPLAIHNSRFLYSTSNAASASPKDLKNVVIHSGTGSGKTLAYLLPILDPILHDLELQIASFDYQKNKSNVEDSLLNHLVSTIIKVWTRGHVRVLICTPSNELSFQIYSLILELLNKFFNSLSLTISKQYDQEIRLDDMKKLQHLITNVLSPTLPCSYQYNFLSIYTPYILITTPNNAMNMIGFQHVVASNMNRDRRTNISNLELISLKRLVTCVIDEVDSTTRRNLSRHRRQVLIHKKPVVRLISMLHKSLRKNEYLYLCLCSATVNHPTKDMLKSLDKLKMTEYIHQEKSASMIPSSIQHYFSVVEDSIHTHAKTIYDLIERFNTSSALVVVGPGQPIYGLMINLTQISNSKSEETRYQIQAIHDMFHHQSIDEMVDQQIADPFLMEKYNQLVTEKRDQTLRDFRTLQKQILLVTDTNCRGFDIDRNIPLVIILNPTSLQLTNDYIHLAGRTGRLDQDGVVVTLFFPNTVTRIRSLQKNLPYVNFSPIDLYPHLSEVLHNYINNQQDEREIRNDTTSLGKTQQPRARRTIATEALDIIGKWRLGKK